MLNLTFINDISQFESGLELLLKDFEIKLSENGIPIAVEKSDTDQILASYDGETGVIKYSTKNSFYRLLNLWLAEYKKSKTFKIEEKVHFEKNGVMVDSSRNGVLSMDGMKQLLRYMAKLGLNQVMLYTEDTYEVEEYPYCGYLRGRYSQEELKEMDDYAHTLGIEMVPCIQTLAHLYLGLKYEHAQGIRDTSDILLVGEPKTYEFIENLIKAAIAPFRSNKIHIGMDEAFGLGSGIYKQKHGERDKFSIMNDHLKQVIAITEKYNLEPMMWSDMFYRSGSETGEYYDLESVIPEEIIKDIPEIDMVLWDYYHEDEETYDILISKHKEMKKKVIYAGGLWTWNGIAPNYGKAFETTKAGMASAKNHNIKEVFTTLWGDDGAETPIFSAMPGLQLFADLSYRDEVNEEQMAAEFNHNTGYSLNEFMRLNDFDETPGVMKNNLKTSAPSKFLLWQDPLLGFYDETIADLNMTEHYEKLAENLKPLSETKGDFKSLFSFYFKLAEVLSDKAEFGLNLKEAYDQKDKDGLKESLETAKKLQKAIESLRGLHEQVWLEQNKPFGWEVMDIRYGGVQTRMGTTIKRIHDYLEGNIKTIDELEEKKLPFSAPYPMSEGTLGRGLYKDMITPGKLSGV